MIPARALQVLWPAFLLAGVMEMLIFAVIDPNDLQWFGGEPIAWSRQAIYTVTFVLCWGVTATSSALTALLMSKTANELNAVDTAFSPDAAPDTDGGGPVR